MRPVFINLTEKQVEYLTAIKEQHGITYSSYMRTLLMRDMLGGSRSDSAPIIREDKIIKSQKITTTRIVRTESTVQWMALHKEMAPILAKRRAIVDNYCLT